MSDNIPANPLYFLNASGEMGERMRNHHWQETAVGDPVQWPFSLRNTVGILLHSKFPMFLFWGEQLTCFYNDAYRPSLGNNGKHPSALGKPGVEVFPEIWKDIKPLIDGVIAGEEAIMNHNLLLPIYRNGQLEDVYWTFCYSAAFNDDGNIGGVIVVCQETKPQLMNKLLESEGNLKAIIDQSPMSIGLLRGKDMVIETGNARILEAWGKDASVVGMPLAEALPELVGQPFLDLLDEVYQTGNAHYAYAMPAKLVRNGHMEDVYSDFVYTPLRDAENNVTGVLVLASVNTEQVLSRKALERSEARFRSLVKAAPVAIGLFVGRDLIIEEPNQAFIDIVGKGDDIIGGPLVAAMPELITEGQPFLQILDDVYTKGEAFSTKATVVKIVQNGVLTNNYYDFSYTPMVNEKGEVYAILDIAIDVTAQVTAQKALEKSEQNLRNIIMQAPVAMALLIGKDAIIELANERMYELWGRVGADFSGKPVFDCLPETEGSGLKELLQNVILTGEAYHGYEVPIPFPRNGVLQVAYVNFVYEAFRDNSGKIIGVMAVGIDVTDQVLGRKKVEENKAVLQEAADKLRHTRDSMQLAIEAGELGTFEINIQTGELKASARFSEIFDLNETAVRDGYLDAIHPDDKPIRDSAYKASMNTGSLDYTVRVIHKDNNIVWVRIKGKVIYNEQREPMTMMGVVQDITESKELEFQKDSFLGIASHELKTPVTSIKAYAQVMEAMFRKSGDVKFADMMSRVNNQVTRLNNLISDLLDVTKINSGKLQFNITQFDFKELVEEVTEELQRVTERHTLETSMEFTGIVRGDRERISQVITNLVSNAVKYSPNATHIKIYTQKDQNEVVLCVEDFGIGIREDKQHKVFEQFYRVSGDKQHTFPGLGLGLYISSEIVKRMGGRIWVNSIEGQGSTFCFSFPVAEEPNKD